MISDSPYIYLSTQFIIAFAYKVYTDNIALYNVVLYFSS